MVSPMGIASSTWGWWCHFLKCLCPTDLLKQGRMVAASMQSMQTHKRRLVKCYDVLQELESHETFSS